MPVGIPAHTGRSKPAATFRTAKPAAAEPIPTPISRQQPASRSILFVIGRKIGAFPKPAKEISERTWLNPVSSESDHRICHGSENFCHFPIFLLESAVPIVTIVCTK
jgi:hypothetical protein